MVFTSFIIYDPLEQFELFGYFSILRVSGLFTTLCHCFLLCQLFSVLTIFNTTNLGFFFLCLFNFSTITVKSNLALKRYPHFLYLYIVFAFIFLCNILGMVAYSQTITSSLYITLFFSLSYFFAINFYGFLINLSTFFKMFVPRGVPFAIIPSLFLIEILSYLSRVVSLSVRLFANMLSGHALLKILCCFVGVLVSSKYKKRFNRWFFSNIFCIVLPILLTVVICCLEIIIAFLQAYVYLVLSIIYLSNVLYIH